MNRSFEIPLKCESCKSRTPTIYILYLAATHPAFLCSWCATKYELEQVHIQKKVVRFGVKQWKVQKERPKNHGPGYVYLIECGGEYKIGHSSNPHRRARKFQTDNSKPVVLLHTIHSQDALLIETFLHKRFQAKRLADEWFQLKQEDVDYIIKFTQLP